MGSEILPAWNEHALENCMSAIIDYRGKTPRKTVHGVPLITAKVVKGGRIQTPDEFIDPAEYDEWMRRGLPQPGDVLLTTEAPLGEVAQLGPEKVALAQRLIALRGKSDLLNNTFLKFLLQSEPVQKQLAARASGSTVSGIKQSELRKIKLRLPPLQQQYAIAHILGTLDDKIELNRRMNQTLEAMARAIFKSWFVDFDPVHANAAARTGSPRSANPIPGLTPEIAKLFPAEFEDSELGRIPKGWKVRCMKECCERIHSGGTPRRDEPTYWENATIPWLTSGEVRQPIITKTENFISELGLKESSAKWVPGKSTVVALYGATAGQVSFLVQRATTNQAVCCLVPKSGFEYFNYFSMRNATSGMENMAVGSAQQNISKGIVESTSVVLSPYNILLHYNKAAAPLFAKWICSREETHALMGLRDTLLPKLIVGELRVTDVERLKEKASK